MKPLTYSIITYGCQMNISDSERIAGLLNSIGFIHSPSLEKSSLIIVNFCSVRQSAFDRAMNKLKNFSKEKIIITTGCVLEKDKKLVNTFADCFVPIDGISIMPAILKQYGFKIKKNEPKTSHYLKISPAYQSKIIAYIPIMTGCNNFCSYCVVPYTRNREISRPINNIVKEAKQLAENGIKEIWLLGQNVNSYKYKSYLFSDLLKKINDIKGDFWIRFMSSHPKDLSKDLIKTFSLCKKVAPYLNLPIQSGDNKILKKMNRPYTINHYKSLINNLRKEFKKNRKGLESILSLSTDVIVGFPTETKKQFDNTLNLFKELQYSNAYIACYSPRSQTAAFLLKDSVLNCDKKKRERKLTETVKQTALQFNNQFKDKIVDVLILEKIKDAYIGKTRHYQTIKIKTKKNISGKFVKAKVIKVFPFGIEGKLVEK
ncbi:MAG: MiaB/RimO family radical SAM methylthiotransferase [Candidatus Pacebacteria bacterium]|nr:MiaB/RimO family radical SAM methylthiotransferase [Candidatus Paceibacterota bacterium]